MSASAPAPPARPGRRTLLAGVAVALALGVLATVAVGPRPPRLGDAATGDAALLAQVRAVLGDGTGYGAVAVAVVEDGRVRLAGLGRADDPGQPAVDGRTRFEIGSIGKALTGMLLADLVEAGELGLDDRVGDLVPGTPLAGSGDATLAELSSHRSGLPRIAPGLADLLRSVGTQVAGIDPYSGTPREVLAVAADAGPTGGADFSYSNLGAGALGSALAVHQGQPYGDLLRQRLLTPLGMVDTTVVTDAGDLPRPRAAGATAAGRHPAPWIAEGYAGAGIGHWSSAGDLARLAAAVLDGSAPGAAAAQPRWSTGDGDQIGLGWFVSDLDGRTVTWHNGGTGGFRSYLGIDRDAGRAVVVLAATSLPVERLARQLLTGGGAG